MYSRRNSTSVIFDEPTFAAKSTPSPPPPAAPIPQSAKTKMTKTAMTAHRTHLRCLKFSLKVLSIPTPRRQPGSRRRKRWRIARADRPDKARPPA